MIITRACTFIVYDSKIYPQYLWHQCHKKESESCTQTTSQLLSIDRSVFESINITNKNTLSIDQQIILELTRYIMNQLCIKCHKENH